MRKTLLASLLGLSALLPLGGCAPLAVTGVGVGVLMADDRRTPSAYLMDEEIELTARHRLNEAKFDGAHINFTSFNRRVLITGEAVSADLKIKVNAIAKAVPNVREIIDEVVISAPTSLGARTNDGYVTAKVKTRFLDDKGVSAHQIKVVTESNVVYLMGLVKREEGARAAEVAAKTEGVARIVKAFEYID